jgi:hypothetical protein
MVSAECRISENLQEATEMAEFEAVARIGGNISPVYLENVLRDMRTDGSGWRIVEPFQDWFFVYMTSTRYVGEHGWRVYRVAQYVLNSLKEKGMVSEGSRLELM